MSERFVTGGAKIYDKQTGNEYLLNCVDADDIVRIMNNLDEKAKERSKALSTLQKKYDVLHKENEKLEKSYYISEDVNDAISKCNEELELIRQELADENKMLKDRIQKYVDKC